MCGRYTLALPLSELLAALQLDLPDFDFVPRYNLAPSQRLPIITNEGSLNLRLHRWGLIPFWAKNPAIGHKMINARGETLAEKPAFREALRQRRCLIPADGFYEWQKTPYGKVPHHIHFINREVMTFAGLWESWRDAQGKEIRSFTIITTSPNALMAPIHDRMPVIIPAANRMRWLEMDLPQEAVLAQLCPYPAHEMQADPVSNAVNSPRNEGPSLLDPPAPSLF
ncbi:MAG TPA: SOS response-associated peptidase [Bacteroidetes bacterium]|nr:SOS response-associated peptidase [Bacteroidota bacterium]